MLAIAVSGGADSMALAKLCASVEETKSSKATSTSPKFKFRAFVVDHKAREGSEVEASLVKRSLNQMGRFPLLLSSFTFLH